MSDTAINPVTRRVQFTGNTGTGPFAFTFNILTDGDIAVYKNTTALTLTADYSVTINVNGTGSVTLVAALVSTDVLTIIGGRQLARTTDFVTAGDLLASSLNEQLDSNVIMAQQLDEKLGRGLYVNPGDVYTDLELPLKDDRKGTVLGFNATTGDPEPGPEIGDVDSLAAISGDIKTLAEIQDGTVATDAITNVNTIRANVTTVAGISGNVTTVAGNATNINAVAADATDIGLVAGSIANVNLTAESIGSVNTNAANITAIQGAAGNAATATTKASEAEAARDAAIAAKNAAEAVDVITNATATASTLSAGSSATASVTATSGTGAFSFGIPTGAQGIQGNGWTSGSYNASNGVVTFVSDDGLGFVTGDLRGATGVGDLLAANNLSDLVNAVTARTNLGLGTAAITAATAYATSTQGTTADDALPKAGGTMTGNIVMPALGTVDGRDLSVDGDKLDLIAAGATADQTGAQIKTAYEAETNAFTDAQFTKLAGIQAYAKDDQTGAEIKTAYEARPSAFTDAQFTKLSNIEADAEVNQNAYASLTILDASGSNISGTSALNKQQLLVLQEGPGVSIDKINYQQFQISAIPDLYSSFEVSPTAQPSATGDNAVAIGDGAVGYGDDAISIGELSQATGNKSISLGYSAKSSGDESVALGKSAGTGVSSVSIGITGGFSYGSAGVNSITIGQLAKATQANSIAIGDAALSATANLIALGGTTDTVKISGAYTLPTTDGTSSQVLQTNGSGVLTFASAGSGTGDLLAANNLSDLANAATARTNLGLGTAAITASTAYATAAQGTTADAALPKAGGALTGPVTTSSTFDGRDVSVDGLKLDGIAAGATNTIGNATHTGEVTGSGALTIADNVVDEANLKVSNAPTNGYVLSAQSGNTGGLTWVASGGGGGADLYAANEVTPTAQPSATGTNAVAIGDSAIASDSNSLAGPFSRSAGSHSVALGIANNSSSYGAGGSYSVSIGYQSRAMALQSVALGAGAYVDSDSSRGLALGENAYVQQCDYGTALGAAARVYGGNTATEATAIGSSYASGTASFAAVIANNTSSYGATGSSSVAIGQNAKASHTTAVALGGSYNTSSGVRSVTLGGEVNTASAENSYAFGVRSVADKIGQYAFGNWIGQQGGLMVLQAATTNATPKAMSSSSSGASYNNQLILPNNSAYSFSGTIIARQQAADGSDYASWEIKGALLRDANAASTVLGNGIVNKLFATAGASAWAIALTADTTNGCLKVEATGAAATDIKFVATVNTAEVTYA